MRRLQYVSPETLCLSAFFLFYLGLLARRETGVVVAGDILAEDDTQLQDVADKKPLTVPSFP